MTEQPLEMERYLKFLLIYMLTSIMADTFGTFLGTLITPVVSNCAFFPRSPSITNHLGNFMSNPLHTLDGYFCGRYKHRIYVHVLRLPGALQSHAGSDAVRVAAVLQAILDGGSGAGAVRQQPGEHDLSGRGAVLPLSQSPVPNPGDGHDAQQLLPRHSDDAAHAGRVAHSHLLYLEAEIEKYAGLGWSLMV